MLGSVLLDNDVLHEIVPILAVADFYRDSHQIIYQAIRDMYDEGKGIDAVTLADELTRRDQFQKIGGDETLRRSSKASRTRRTPSTTPRSSGRNRSAAN